MGRFRGLSVAASCACVCATLACAPAAGAQTARTPARVAADASSDGTVSLSQSAYTANENQGEFTVTIVRTGSAAAIDSDEYVRYGVHRLDAEPGIDFRTVPNTVAHFVPGQTTYTFEVPIIDRGIALAPPVEADIYIFGSWPESLGAYTNAHLTILRNDPLDTRDDANPLAFTPEDETYPSPNGDPLTDANFYRPGSASAPGEAAARIAHSHPALARELDVLADAPLGHRFWFWNTQNNPAGLVSHYLENVEQTEPNTVVQLTTYSLVHDAPGSTATPAFAARYARWIQGVAQGIGNYHVVMYLEIDSLITSPGLTPAQRAIRFAEVAGAVRTLEQDPHVVVYIDAGAADALPWRVAARWLAQEDIQQAQGFFLNATHFDWTSTEARYGQLIARSLGGVHFVINTGGSGRGPLATADRAKDGNEQLCNPPGRGLGPLSTSTGLEYVDAFMWMSVPGNSGGACRPGAPPTAVFWPAYAEMLVRNADFQMDGPREPLLRQGRFAAQQPRL